MTSVEKLPDQYNEDSIQSLSWNEHIRRRPGMYIGKLGDGSAPDDGIYVLAKEIIDNSIDEFIMGNGKRIDITVEEERMFVRDFGRGIPLGKVVDCVSKINTGGKYDSGAFQKSVGLNGVGTKAVNALSSFFKVTAFREGQKKTAEFSQGVLLKEYPIEETTEPNGTLVEFFPDEKIFVRYRFLPLYLEEKMWNYAYLNPGLTLVLNNKKFASKNGLLDLLTRHTDETIRYPIIHVMSKDIEFAFSHAEHYGEHYYSFVNGQHTTEGGTHQQAFREAIVKTVREFFKKDFEPSDIRASIIAALSVRIQEPVFESQTKNKLGSMDVTPGGIKIKAWIGDFVKQHLDNYLHKNPEPAQKLLYRIQQNERERKEIAGIKKLANDRAKKANIHNKKLRDCKVHYNDVNNKLAKDTMIFITEGDSASGSITKARNPAIQAVFSLKGKPKNCFGITKKFIYENEEFNLLQHALDLENGIDNLRFHKVIIATDADVDGMHIRLLLMTFFLQYFPEIVEAGHLHILQTPLFRVRNKAKTIYCYSEVEKELALKELGAKSEITRFKGLGEISPSEFGAFIGEDIRLDRVSIPPDVSVAKMLEYYMGNNTLDRQNFILANLKIEEAA